MKREIRKGRERGSGRPSDLLSFKGLFSIGWSGDGVGGAGGGKEGADMSVDLTSLRIHCWVERRRGNMGRSVLRFMNRVRVRNG